MKHLHLFPFIFIICLFLSGCGQSTQTAENTEETRISYLVEEYLLPEPDLALSQCSEYADKSLVTFDQGMLYGADHIYRLIQVAEGDILNNEPLGSCLQVSEIPYDKWITYTLPDTISTLSLVSADADSFCAIYSDGEKISLGEFTFTGETITSVPLPDSVDVIGNYDALSWYPGQDCIYELNRKTYTLRSLDAQYQELSSQTLNNKLDINAPLAPSSESVYFANSNGIFQGDTTGQLLSFQEVWYAPTHVFSLSVQEDLINAVVEFGGFPYLLKIRENTEEPAEKEEIVLASTLVTDNFQRLVEHYNRTSEKYRLVISCPDTNTNDVEDFCRNIQMELSAGKGPDILTEYCVSSQALADSGFLMPLDSVIEDSNLFYTPALQNGQENGITYGIPYNCQLRFLVASDNITQERSSWTLEEMIAAVQGSDADYFADMSSPIHSLLYCSLYDEANKSLIDWDARVSYLNQEPFRSLVEFIKNYKVADTFSSQSLFDALQSGQVAAQEISLNQLADMNYIEACFNGFGNPIGYPGTEGKGVYMSSENLYANKSTSCPEGVTDFLTFLISEKGQLLLTSYSDWSSLPVRKSTLEYLVAHYQYADSSTEYTNSFGITWDQHKLTEQQLTEFRELLNNAKPSRGNAIVLYDILYE